MAPDVSVVVPVWNPGPDIQRCLDGLAAQTLDHERFEAIFVDDGSDDGTGERLESLAASTPWLHVIRQENSGWAGKPRNVGTDAAQGRYVQYLDQDDVLPPQALERQLRMADEAGSDVVLGKVTSDFRGVMHGVYRENRTRCTAYDAPLINSLTPHKMFRLDFLRQHDIRWAEGKRRLEDQLYMAQVYFAPGCVASIVADTVCYRYLRRTDRKNAGNRRLNPQGYYDNLREVLDAVEAGTEPGSERDRFLARFLQTEVIRRLGAGRMDSYPEDYRADMVRTIHTLVDERFPTSVDAHLPPVQRTLVERLRHGDIDGLYAASVAAESIRAKVTLADARWTSAGLELDVAAALVRKGRTLTLDREGDDWLLPRSLFGDVPSAQARMIGPDFGPTPVDVVVRQRRTYDEWFVGPQLQIDESEPGAARWRGRVVLDPATAAFGEPLGEGVQDLFTRVWGFGIRQQARIAPVPGRTAIASYVAWVRPDVGLVQQYLTDEGNLSLDVRPTPAQAGRRISPVKARVEGGAVVVRAPILQAGPGRVHLRLLAGATTVELEATGRSVEGSDLADYAVPLASLAHGVYRMHLVLQREDSTTKPVVTPVERVLRIRARGADIANPPGQWRARALRASRKLRRSAGKARTRG